MISRFPLLANDFFFQKVKVCDLYKYETENDILF